MAGIEQSGEAYVITDAGRPRAVLAPYVGSDGAGAPAEEGYAHITREPGISGGEPIIRGTRITVRHIVERANAGESVTEILEALPHLTAGQVHAALAYYYDHREEIEQLIAEAQPKRVVEQLGLTATRIADGVYELHDRSGRW